MTSVPASTLCPQTRTSIRTATLCTGHQTRAATEPARRAVSPVTRPAHRATTPRVTGTGRYAEASGRNAPFQPTCAHGAVARTTMCSTTKTRVNVASETCRPKRVAADGRRVPRAHGWDRTRPVVTSAARRRYDAMPLARSRNQLIGCGPLRESRTSKAVQPRVAAPAMTASARPSTASGEGTGRASDIAAPPDHHRVQLGGRPDRPVLLDPRRGELEALGPRADLGRAGQEQGLAPDLRPRGIRGHGRHGHQTVAARAAT